MNDDKIAALMAANPGWSRRKIAEELNMSPNTVRVAMDRIRGGARAAKKSICEFRDDALLHLRNGPTSPECLCKAVGLSVDHANELVAYLKAYGVSQEGHFLCLDKPKFGRISMEAIGEGQWAHIGLVADTHLCSTEERLDALHAMYDLFAQEGVRHVFHAGNIVDGYIQRINGAGVLCSTPDDQALYVVDNYPNREGVTTHYITADDHEGWWIQAGLNWGAYLETLARQAGRTDLHYLGHVEADVELPSKSGRSVMMKVQHPGGGSAYARSYKAQKQIEAFEGGEKPSILVQGHYHVSNYMFDRNVHVVNLPGFQAQTVFARKKHLRFEVGGVILRVQIHDDGSVGRFQYESRMFFDRTFYKPFLRSDARVVKGHMTLDYERQVSNH